MASSKERVPSQKKVVQDWGQLILEYQKDLKAAPPKPKPRQRRRSSQDSDCSTESGYQTQMIESPTEAILNINEVLAAFIYIYLWDDVISIKEWINDIIDIKYDSSTFTIEIVGTTNGIELAAKSLQLLSKEVLSKYFKLVGPGFRKVMEMDTTRYIISGIERQHHCVFVYHHSDNNNNQGRKSAANRLGPHDDCEFLFPSDEVIKTKAGQRVAVVDGDLSKQMVDAIVNTTNSNVDLKANRVGKALLKVGGKDFEKLCKQISNLNVGEAAKTSGGKLKCKHVYHVFCGIWNEGKGEKVLREILKKCLLESVKDNHFSLAIPAIGTGVMAFPVEVVAKVFFEEVLYFLKTNPESSLRDVRFVVPKREVADAFRAEIKLIQLYSSKVAGKNNDSILNETSFSLFKCEKDPDGCSLEIYLDDNVPIQIVLADITKESTDVIMHVTNPKLSLEGGVARSLVNAGGDAIVKECQAISSNIIHLVNYTSAGNLLARQIAHVIATDQPSADDLVVCLDGFFDDVTIKGFNTVSFSAIGSGAVGLSEKLSAKLILMSLKKHLSGGASSLSLIRIVIFEKEKFERFVAAVEAYPVLTPTSPRCPPELKDNPLSFQIFGLATECIDKAWNYFEKKMREDIETKVITDDSIARITEEEVDEILRLSNNYDVEAVVKRDSCCVEVTGHLKDIHKVIDTIQEIVKSEVPRYWAPQPKDANGHEVAVYRFELDRSSAEFEEISDEFLRTASTCSIRKIERIQNPALFQLFAKKRKLMDEKNGSNEKKLFHGTSVEALGDIETHGLNRSLSGKNANLFGLGVYFAVDAKYSCQKMYSRPDNQGFRYLYYARVLVGDYTLGKEGIKQAPLKDSSKSTERYDSVVNDINDPTIFVIFQDNECYTEYLITFM